MALAGWRTVLVLGGIGSGRSEFARSLLGGTHGADQVREVTGAGGDLAALARVLDDVEPTEALLVDGLDGWLPSAERVGTAAGGTSPAAVEGVSALAEVLRDSPGRIVLVSPEVGLLAHPATAEQPSRTEAITSLNRAVAEAVDAAVLVVAGQPVWLKGGPDRTASQLVTAGAVRAVTPADLANLSALPHPDEHAEQSATGRLVAAGFGALAPMVGFAAGTQSRTVPAPWRSARVLVLRGDRDGGAAAGAPDPALLATGLRDGTGDLTRLAADTTAELQLVEVGAVAAMEHTAALGDETAVDRALARGWALAGQAAQAGVDVLIIGSIGAGADTAAAAVAAALAGAGAEPAALLGRVRTPDGTIDDRAWIDRCTAVRDGLHRAKSAGPITARTALGELGGEDLATATGIILGAAAHRTPVLLDGPVGAAAAQAARVLATSARRWCRVPDHGGHPTVARVCELLGLSPVLDLGLDLGEGAASLAALPLLRAAMSLADRHLATS